MVTQTFTEAELWQAAERLPTAPRLLVELGQLMNDPDVEAEEVVGLLRQDSKLVAHLIRIANSAAYAPAEPIGSIERAVSFVGFAEVHRLVGALATAQLSAQATRLYPLDAAKFRMSTLFVAVLMEELAKPAGESPRSCYTVGLLRTIGMMALEQLAPAEAGIPPFAESGETELDVWERRHWGISNVEVAEKLLRHWRLPTETAGAIRHHYRPEGRHNPLIHLLALAAGTAADRFWGIPGEQGYWQLTPENFEKAGLTNFGYQMACDRAQKKYSQLKIAVD